MTPPIVFIAIMIVFGIYDIRAMAKEKLKKEIILYCAISVISALIAICYAADPLRAYMLDGLNELINNPL